MDGGSWHCIGVSDQGHPQEKKAKWLTEEALKIAEKRREVRPGVSGCATWVLSVYERAGWRRSMARQSHSCP